MSVVLGRSSTIIIIKSDIDWTHRIHTALLYTPWLFHFTNWMSGGGLLSILIVLVGHTCIVHCIGFITVTTEGASAPSHSSPQQKLSNFLIVIWHECGYVLTYHLYFHLSNDTRGVVAGRHTATSLFKYNVNSSQSTGYYR